MEEDNPNCMESFECKKKRLSLMREKALKRPFLEEDDEEPPRKMNRRNGTLVINEKNEEDRAPEKYKENERSGEEEHEKLSSTEEIYIEDEEDQVPETYKEKERLMEEEDPWRPMKNYVEGIIALLHDDLENRLNERMEQIEVGLDLPAVEVEVEVGEDEDPPPDFPEDLRARIREMNGTHLILVLEKQLFKTDIKKVENRLSIPLNQIRREFLTEEEKVRVVEGMQVMLIEPSLEESTIIFKRWKMKKNCYLYVFTKQWHKVVIRNSLKTRDLVQVWSFRIGSELRFALVKVRRDG